MISIVCVYNNKKILHDYLLRSLKNQTSEFELIVLDNRRGKFKSAAEALNHGGKEAKGKYIMFVHQDIDLSSISWLGEVEKILDELPDLGIAGVAGGSESKKGVLTNIKHGMPRRLAGNIQIEKPTKIQTLDECLVIIPKNLFDILEFDEKVCDDWHLYTVDYCLSVKELNYCVYVIPMFVYHRSSAYSMSARYYLTLKKVLKKHRRHCTSVHTTMGVWSTLYPLKIQRVHKMLRKLVRVMLKKY